MPSGAQPTEKRYDFASQSNVNNFHGIDNGGG